MGERPIPYGDPLGIRLIGPGLGVVLPPGLVVSAEKACLGLEVVGLVHQERRVRVLGHVLPVEEVIIDNIVDHAPDEGNVCTRTCLLYTSDAADDLLCVDLGG